MDRTLYISVVTIQYVKETVTRGGLRRFEIGAERQPSTDTLAETRLSFATLDQFKAALCDQAWKQGFPVTVKHMKTAWFDDALLHVEMVKDEAHA